MTLEQGKPPAVGRDHHGRQARNHPTTCFHTVGYMLHLANTTSLLTKETGCIHISGTDLLISGKVVPSLSPKERITVYLYLCNWVIYFSVLGLEAGTGPAHPGGGEAAEARDGEGEGGESGQHTEAGRPMQPHSKPCVLVVSSKGNLSSSQGDQLPIPVLG